MMDFILTTPNTFYPVRSLRGIYNNDPKCHDQHTAWYSPRVLKTLFARSRFNVLKIDYFSPFNGGMANEISKIFNNDYILPNILY